MIVKPENLPIVGQDIELMICWLNERPMQVGAKYHVKHTSNDARCMVKDVVYRMNINSLEKMEGETSLKLNDIARIKIRTTKPLVFDSYKQNRITGSLILVDEGTNETVGAGMIL
jgi:sulfate adenylyltransferase subunit 1